MKSSSGTRLQYTVFGESHSTAIGITIQGIPANTTINFALVDAQLALRSGKQKFNTKRQEANNYEIISGFFDGKTTGTPFTVLFPNNHTKSKDYNRLKEQPRPGHADYVTGIKYQQAQDYRGGGHFSGRLTTPLVFLGAIAYQLLQQAHPELEIHSHIASLAGIDDTNYYAHRRQAVQQLSQDNGVPTLATLLATTSSAAIKNHLQQARHHLQQQLQAMDDNFPLLNQSHFTAMQAALQACIKHGDTLGGQIETIITQPPLALGEPLFHSIESKLTQLLFAVGSVKAVGFGLGTAFGDQFGSQVKDEILAQDATGITTLYNYNGGINGGISNGEDIVFTTTLKPIASLMQAQTTLSLSSQTVETLHIGGRHDVSIINRVIPVINAVTAIVLYDLYLEAHS